MLKYLQETPFALTICDKDGKILEMNEHAVKVNCKDGEPIIGNNLLDCHPEPAKSMLESMLLNHNVNAYTIEKSGVKKLIYQSPWYKNGEFAGYLELSMEIPFEMSHYVRKPKAQ